MSKATKSKTSPKGGNRGCLCKDGTYKKECCNGDLQNQGIGSTVGQNSNTTITNIDGTRTIVSNNG
jgi:hypothetical protein